MKHAVTALFQPAKKTKVKHHKKISTKKRYHLRFPHWSKIILTSVLLSFLCFPNTWADSQSNLHLSIDKTEGSTDDIFTLDITLKKATDENYFSLENNQIPGLENFQIVGNSSTTNVQMINGAIAAISEKKLKLQPKQEGTFVLGPIKITSNTGEIIESESVVVNVEKSLTQKTKESLLAPLQKENSNSQIDNNFQKTLPKEDTTNDISSQNYDTNQKDIMPLSSEKIQTTDFTNWYFWLQIFGGVLLFTFGILIGGKFSNHKTE